MSVMTFGAAPLANVAAAVLNSKHRPSSSDVHYVCGLLAKISEANVACFNDRYRLKGAEAEKPVLPSQIEHCLSGRAGKFLCDLGDAVSVASLLHYNCDDEGGDFTLKVEGAAAALAEVLSGMMVLLAQKAGLDQ